MSGDQAASSVDAIANKFGVSIDAVNTALAALRRGSGSMAQFSHADFGGMAQWSNGGMSMVGDMFNTGMKDKLNGVMQALADSLGNGSIGRDQPGSSSGRGEGSLEEKHSQPLQASRWPAAFGTPSSSGSQNDMHYAFFPSSKRLAIEEKGTTTFYDTGDHQISGVSQQQSDSRSIRFQSQDGPVSLHDLKPVDWPR
jgi:hypothetical protein